uniref:TF-B3 domain-containing protein n=1 Tax=Oryza rufipogon TaxID=4529 RepID=A0A0E0PI69_ORYRU
MHGSDRWRREQVGLATRWWSRSGNPGELSTAVGTAVWMRRLRCIGGGGDSSATAGMAVWMRRLCCIGGGGDSSGSKGNGLDATAELHRREAGDGWMPMKLMKFKDKRATLTTGWNALVGANLCEQADVCVFLFTEVPILPELIAPLAGITATNLNLLLDEAHFKFSSYYESPHQMVEKMPESSGWLRRRMGRGGGGDVDAPATADAAGGDGDVYAAALKPRRPWRGRCDGCSAASMRRRLRRPRYDSGRRVCDAQPRRPRCDGG